MAEPETKPTKASVTQFLEKTAGDRLDDCKALVRMMKKVTGEAPKMWGPSIVGFGTYHSVYASGLEGDWPVAAFSPRKGDLTIYVLPGFAGLEEHRARLGRHRMGKSCLYIKRLADVDTKVLERIIADSMKQVRKTYG